MTAGASLDRVAELWAHFSTDHAEPYRAGSGYLIGGRMILTAAHVVVRHGPARRVRVRIGLQPALWTASVRWWRIDEIVDAALVEITDTDWTPPAQLTGMRWGALSGRRPQVACEAVGFPFAMKRPVTHVREPERIRSSVGPLTLDETSRYAIDVDGAVPRPKTEQMDPAPWSGMPGAAVWSAGLMIGVVSGEARTRAHRRLAATRVEELVLDAGFAELATSVTGRLITLESAELAGFLVPAGSDAEPASPALLLKAQYEIVPFHGRGRELAELRAWCQEPAALGIRLITGQGGQGKTRLARQLATELSSEGWICGTVSDALRPPALPDASAFDALATTRRPALIVVDHAEIRGELIRVLAERLAAAPRPVRVLLLARAIDDWWHLLRSGSRALAELLGGGDVVHALGPLDAGVSGRRAAFASAAAALASRLHGIAWSPRADWPALARLLVPPAELEHERYDSVLAVHTAALASLLQSGPGAVEVRHGDTTEDILLGHEERYWAHSAGAGSHRPRITTDTMRVLIATATLCGASDEREASGVLAALASLPEAEREAAAGWLGAVYPGETYWGPLRPDRLGEHHIARQCESHPALLDRALDGASPRQIMHAMLVLARAARHEPCLRPRLRAVVAASPGRLGPVAAEAAARTDYSAALIEALDGLATGG